MYITHYTLFSVIVHYYNNSSTRTLSRTGALKHALQERSVLLQMTILKQSKLKPLKVTVQHLPQQQQQQALTPAASNRTREQRLKLSVVKLLEAIQLPMAVVQQQRQQQAVARKLDR
jgi:hypothetical protein